MASAAGERSRRTLLAGLVGSAVALVASSLARPAAALATDDNDVLNGFDNDVTQHRTLLHNTHSNVSDSTYDQDVDALFGFAENNGAGVAGQSTGGPGVKGWSGPIPMPNTLSSRVGVYGAAPNTVGTGVEGDGLTGVIGNGNPVGGSGVVGNGYYGVQGNGSGYGVYATSADGHALYGQSGSGFALHTSGRLKFETSSGVATIAANTKSITVTPPYIVLSASSFVLLTPNANIAKRALWYTINTSTNKITISISTVYSTTKALNIAWLLLN